MLKIEEAGMFILAFYLSILLGYTWWVFVLFLLVPDISMIGYLFGNKAGANIYSFFHQKSLAVLVGIVGYVVDIPELTFSGIILFGHSSFDRLTGYGLKYSKGFNYTHLGAIRKNKQ
ncbi:DUF4260 domain-containing protein [Sunxiuqinia sp. A32]|uniref:DUF4260 domain-containing protein n=1 Tax=Sunxiuqinia sp. A32 TaxID=3461496 RepID=UPI00404586B7